MMWSSAIAALVFIVVGLLLVWDEFDGWMNGNRFDGLRLAVTVFCFALALALMIGV